LSLVDARRVTKTYHAGSVAVPALVSVDLEVERGEMTAVVGPSGSGKTTLLNCLSGLDEIDSGEVWIAGEEIHSMSDRRRTAYRGKSMGFIFQAYNLIPVFSALENVELPLLLNGASPREAREGAAATLVRVGLGRRFTHRPGELSGGEQQRVAIARALVGDPVIVWADEPTGNLDTENAQNVMDLLGELNADGLTIVLVTHDPTISSRAGRLVLMRDGRIVDETSSSLGGPGGSLEGNHPPQLPGHHGPPNPPSLGGPGV
jgi:putative ABC transport system ATP-binding protein